MDFDDKIISILPHGSGIDYDWTIERRGNKVVCNNAYHRIDENGFYDGIFPFSVTFTKDNFMVKFHKLTSWGRKVSRREMLKDYLEDLFAEYQGAIRAAMD